MSDSKMLKARCTKTGRSYGLELNAYYDTHSKRALVDGGFTRLYYKWDSA